MIIALAGKFKNISEPFDIKKFLPTILIGAVVGAAASYAGLSYDQAYSWLASMGVITLIDQGGKGYVRTAKKGRSLVKAKRAREVRRLARAKAARKKKKQEAKAAAPIPADVAAPTPPQP